MTPYLMYYIFLYIVGFVIAIPISFSFAKDHFKEERCIRGFFYEEDIKINVAFHFVSRIIFWPIYLVAVIVISFVYVILYISDVILLFIGEKMSKFLDSPKEKETV